MASNTIALEEKIAYLEKLTPDLDEVIRDLNSRLAKQERELATLCAKYNEHLSELHEPGIAGEE